MFDKWLSMLKRPIYNGDDIKSLTKKQKKVTLRKESLC
jgi:hypothetical protein